LFNAISSAFSAEIHATLCRMLHTMRRLVLDYCLPSSGGWICYFIKEITSI
jgi:hypothetical protein